jgi:hypothetical protein
VYIFDLAKQDFSARIICGPTAIFSVGGELVGGKLTLVSTSHGTCARSLALTFYPEDIAKLPLGTHKLEVEFPGDGTYAPSVGSFTFTVYEHQPNVK